MVQVCRDGKSVGQRKWHAWREIDKYLMIVAYLAAEAKTSGRS